MSDLPEGWEWATLVDVAEIQGGIQKQAKRRPVANKYPFLRVANLSNGNLDLSDIHETELFEGELTRYRLQFGDLLIIEGNGSLNQLGRAAMWRDEVPDSVHQNHLIRARPYQCIDPRYLAHVWNSEGVRRQLERVGASTSGLHTLSVSKLRPIRLPLPPLAEQQRIVATLEDHLSRLEAGQAYVSHSMHRMPNLRAAILFDAWNLAVNSGAPLRAIGELSQTQLGKMLDKKRNEGVPTEYLRNVNVRWQAIDLSDIQTVPLTPAELSKFDLESGDILVCEGGEPGRCAVWRGQREHISFQKALHRIRVNSDLMPEWVSFMLEHAVRSGAIDHLLTGSTIKHLPQEKLRTIRIPVPTVPQQRQIIHDIARFEDDHNRLYRDLVKTSERSSTLRRALLADAFAGRLVPQNTTDETVSVLLEHVRAERATQLKVRPGRRPKKTNQETLL